MSVQPAFTTKNSQSGAAYNGRTDILIIRGEKIPVTYEEVEQSRLRFYAENPRIYSMIRREGRSPTQDDIEKQLLGMEHVKELVQDIQRNGGLLEAIYVRRGTYDVLEGNSRLAAYRALAKKDPIKWAKMPCILLPEDVPDNLTFALLAQLHLKGKKDWAPFEQAGYLYRRYYDQKIDIPTLSGESNLPQQSVRRLIDTYRFMLKHGETDINKWSYYEELLKSRIARETREKYPSFEKTIVRVIQKDASIKAVDIRDKLPKILAAPTRTVKRFAEGEISFDRAYESALNAGVDNSAYRRLNRLRKWLAEGETAKLLLDSDAEADKIVYELSKIGARIWQIQQMFERRRNR